MKEARKMFFNYFIPGTSCIDLQETSIWKLAHYLCFRKKRRNFIHFKTQIDFPFSQQLQMRAKQVSTL